jgi:riboflavin kinase/FMN adenylyltransferase
VTVGNFDGVHTGHQYLLRQVVDRARTLGQRSLAVTFDPDPQVVLFPERKPPQLTDAAEKVCLIESTGIDRVWVCPFTRELSLLSPTDFMGLVASRQAIGELWIGADFALGRDRTGTIAVLAEIGAAAGWALHMVPALHREGRVVSSTAIRALLASGDVDEAAALLGRPHSVRGTLEHGSARTSLLHVEAERALPPPAVYAACLQVGSETTLEAVATVLPVSADGRRLVRLSPLDTSGRLDSSVPASATFATRLRPLDPGEADEPSAMRTVDDHAAAHATLVRAAEAGVDRAPCS